MFGKHLGHLSLQKSSSDTIILGVFQWPLTLTPLMYSLLLSLTTSSYFPVLFPVLIVCCSISLSSLRGGASLSACWSVQLQLQCYHSHSGGRAGNDLWFTTIMYESYLTVICQPPLFLCPTLSLSVCLSLCLCVSFSLSLSPFICVCLSVSLSPFLCLSFSLSPNINSSQFPAKF